MQYKSTPARIQELRERLDAVEAAAYRLGAASAYEVNGAYWTEAERVLSARRAALHAALYELVSELQFPPHNGVDQLPPPPA
jgi:hypothetical protein